MGIAFYIISCTCYQHICVKYMLDKFTDKDIGYSSMRILWKPVYAIYSTVYLTKKHITVGNCTKVLETVIYVPVLIMQKSFMVSI